jgi:hypothetical protein
MRKQAFWGLAIMMILTAIVGKAETVVSEIHLYVDGNKGSDSAAGKITTPLRTVNEALSRLPRVVEQDITIHIAPGNYDTTGGKGLYAEYLELNHPMRYGARVRIVGNTIGFDNPAPAGSVIFNWRNHLSGFLIVATQGHWTLENIQVGTRQSDQRGGITSIGPAILELRDIRIHTMRQKGPGICAQHSGRIHLYGNIELNEDLCGSDGSDQNFCRIEAEYGGVVKFMQGEGATLTLGNGNLSAAYYGVIELGCEWASITSWNYQSNPIAVNNSGRVDLHNTTTRLCARNPRNTPIGLEHDGHVLAEGAHIIIDGRGNSNAIVLQKASSLFCNNVEIRGEVSQHLLAMSGSFLLVGINGDLGETLATTYSCIIIESCTGRLMGPFKKTKFGQIVLPDANETAKTPPKDGTTGDSGSATKPEFPDPAILPEFLRVVYGGNVDKTTQLIKQGADVRARGPNGWTPLHMAAMGGHQFIAKLLLDNGADIHAKDDYGHTPAQIAKIYGHSSTSEFLRDKESADN